MVVSREPEGKWLPVRQMSPGRGKGVREENCLNDSYHVSENPEGGVYKMRSKWPIVMVVCVALVLAFGSQVAPAKEIKIGVILPLSGPLAPTGKSLREGIELT